LVGEEVLFVVQPEALGTGDAVLHAHKQLADFDGRTLVVWSTQPVIQPETFARTARLATLFASSQLVLPTTFKQRPYAPLSRSENGTVRSSVETHLERADQVDCGETNIGLFTLDNRAMFDVLLDLKKRYWNKETGRYDRPSGELGFPNELINAFAQRANAVVASPFADGREEQGIKVVDDLNRCEQFINELRGANL
jgi:bifunctional N-acetylglucosamine-1-phosphate-uridyltransferase/glucosamine-1-phosphate-acetyltransferase GlmU-like protein